MARQSFYIQKGTIYFSLSSSHFASSHIPLFLAQKGGFSSFGARKFPLFQPKYSFRITKNS